MTRDAIGLVDHAASASPTLMIKAGSVFGVVMSALLTLTMASFVGAAEPIVGQATVIDGDTIEIRGQRIRLAGMDAFETRQSCQDSDGKAYRCGRDAAFALDALIGRRNVTCEPSGKNWDRVVAVCSVNGRDLGGWMVRQGHAVNDDRYDPSYLWSEVMARWTARGAWSGSFERPRDWRSR